MRRLLANDRLSRPSSAPLERLATDPIPACATTPRDAEMFDLSPTWDDAPADTCALSLR